MNVLAPTTAVTQSLAHFFPGGWGSFTSKVRHSGFGIGDARLNTGPRQPSADCRTGCSDSREPQNTLGREEGEEGLVCNADP